MNGDHSFVASLCVDAKACEDAEDAFRRTMNARVAELAEARAFANRRMNVMRSLFDTVSRIEERDAAVAAALAALRQRLGWVEDSAARDEVLAAYRKVAEAAFAATHPADEKDEPAADIAGALAGFEAWYVEARGKPFWVLFEHYMPETQLVDF